MSFAMGVGAAAFGIVSAASYGTSSANVATRAPQRDPAEFSVYPKGKHITKNNSDGMVDIRLASRGITAAKPETLMEVLRRAVEKSGDKIMLAWEEDLAPFQPGVKPAPSAPREEWYSLTIREFADHAKTTSRAFIHLGMKPHSGVAVWGFNAMQWHTTMCAAGMAGGITAGLYTSDTVDQVQYKLEYTSATIAVVESVGHAEKIMKISERCPDLKTIIVWAPEKALPSHGSINILKWSDLPEIAKKVSETELEDRMDKVEPSHILLYCFTSGTTGLPKAAMLSHDSALYSAYCAISEIENDDNTGIFVGGSHERIISYLPLSHIAGTVVDMFLPICLSALGKSSLAVYFARPYDLKASTIVERFKAVEPTLFFGVPRVWEKIMEKMQATVAANPLTGMKLKIARWALGVSSEHQKNCELGGSGAKGLGFGIAKKLILDKVRVALGLSQCKFFVSAAAPLSKEAMEFFAARGIHINEAYGMTESGGPASLATIVCHKAGTVGYPIGGIEMIVKDSNGNECPKAGDIDNPNDACQGEICIRGRSMTTGYLANPKLGEEHVKTMIQKTKEAIDEDGWLHTGDMGVQSETGFFKITGRYKELIIGAGGENIAPVPIENEIKRLVPAISNIMMVGDKRKFNVVMITLKVVGATGELPGTNELELVALDCCSSGVTTVEAACKDPTLIAAITKAIKDTNVNGAVTPSNAAKIQKFTIVPTEFSVEGGELTPTLKLKRHLLNNKYSGHIDAIYESKETYVPFTGSRL